MAAAGVGGGFRAAPSLDSSMGGERRGDYGPEILAPCDPARKSDQQEQPGTHAAEEACAHKPRESARDIPRIRPSYYDVEHAYLARALLLSRRSCRIATARALSSAMASTTSGANFLPPNWRCSRINCLCVISSSLLQKRLPRFRSSDTYLARRLRPGAIGWVPRGTSFLCALRFQGPTSPHGGRTPTTRPVVCL